jgi:SAM-dependent methyltransferase
MNNNLKLKFYYDHVLGTVYSEGESPFHKSITEDVINRFITPENISKDARIIDLGCGPGYFLDEMKKREYTNVQGVTLSREDLDVCQAKGHTVKRSDMNFLDDADESIDMLFSRHSLEHSPFPYITLLEYNRVLKPNGLLYIEVPMPDCDQMHETNKNHFSILGKTMWLSLLQRTGFTVNWYDFEFPLNFDDGRDSVTERYYVFVCRRRMPVDIK